MPRGGDTSRETSSRERQRRQHRTVTDRGRARSAEVVTPQTHRESETTHSRTPKRHTTLHQDGRRAGYACGDLLRWSSDGPSIRKTVRSSRTMTEVRAAVACPSEPSRLLRCRTLLRLIGRRLRLGSSGSGGLLRRVREDLRPSARVMGRSGLGSARVQGRASACIRVAWRGSAPASRTYCPRRQSSAGRRSPARCCTVSC